MRELITNDNKNDDVGHSIGDGFVAFENLLVECLHERYLDFHLLFFWPLGMMDRIITRCPIIVMRLQSFFLLIPH